MNLGLKNCLEIDKRNFLKIKKVIFLLKRKDTDRNIQNKGNDNGSAKPQSEKRNSL